jgi:hypothetical protein
MEPVVEVGLQFESGRVHTSVGSVA